MLDVLGCMIMLGVTRVMLGTWCFKTKELFDIFGLDISKYPDGHANYNGKHQLFDQKQIFDPSRPL